MSSTVGAGPARLDAAGAERPVRARAGSAYAVVVAASALLFIFPAEVALVGPLKGNGGFVRLLGLTAFVMCLARLLHHRPLRPRPVVAVAVIFLAVAVFNWGWANTRPLLAEESASATRFVLLVASGTGLTLLLAISANTRERVNTVLGCLVFGGAFSAFVGMLQVAGIVDVWADVVTLPGMTTIASPMTLSDRSGLTRAYGTTSHPIEYAVCLSMLLPLGIHMARFSSTARRRTFALAAVVLMLLGMPLGISRAGLLALIVSLLIYSLFLSPLDRVTLLLATLLAGAAAVVAAPNVSGAFRQAIFGAADDRSIEGRLNDYPRLIAAWESSPWVGVGPGGARVEGIIDVITDNQWLATLAGYGIVGVFGLAVWFFGGACVAAGRASSAPRGSWERSLGGAVTAGLIAAGISAGTFDFLAFQSGTFLVFVLLGVLGATWATSSTPRLHGTGDVHAAPGRGTQNAGE